MRMKESSKLDIGAKLFILILWLLLLELVQCQNTVPTLPRNEEMALITFLEKLNLKNYNKSMTKTPCNNGGSQGCIYSACNKTICHIKEIVLENQDLDGKISEEVAELAHLEKLSLYANYLTGTIPSGLAKLSSLYYLDLSNNYLTGSIPFGLGTTFSLFYLDLSFNRLSGPIPTNLGKNMNVNVTLDDEGKVILYFKLDLSNNKLVDKIPESLGEVRVQLPHDKTYKDISLDDTFFQINLRSNNLSGRIPDSFKKLTHLTSLSLSDNQLSGPLPTTLGNLKSIQYLSLSDNQLSGPLPTTLGNLKSIQYLSLSDNQLSGPLPTTLGNLKSIQYLWLSDNQLSGPLPPTLGKLKSIQYLYLDGNNFVETLPNNYRCLHSLKELKVFSSKIILLLQLNCGSVAGNCLSGRFPNFVLNWPSIQYLNLLGNQFQGHIDPKIFKMKSLAYLSIADVENSTLSLPKDMNLTDLYYLTLRNCSINGSIPEQLGKNSPYLEHLDMSFNSLTGWIPNSLRNSTNLLYMSFAKNMLNGTIPDWIRDKAKSMQIDLSFNNFSDVGRLKGADKQHDLNLFACCNTKEGPDQSFNLKMLERTCQGKNNFLYINCGGEKVPINGKDYEKDNSTLPYYTSKNRNWAYTSSGSLFNNSSDRIKSDKCAISVEDAPLYKQARFSPVYLSYYGFCLRPGKYNVTLNFSEIVYKEGNGEDEDMSSKRRIFDIYVQRQKIRTDFNIKAEAGKNEVAVVNITKKVDDKGVLEIEFYWAGRGSSRLTPTDYYGPLVSAISAVRDIPPERHLKTKYIVAIAGGSTVLLIGVAFLVWRLHLLHKRNLQKIEIGEGKVVNLIDIKRATRGFSPRTKLGKGNLGIVHKATLKLKDNSQTTVTVAVKKLNQLSNEGLNQLKNDVYKSKILDHENIVQLFDVYIGREGLSFLVLEYMEKKSLQDVMFDPNAKVKYNLDWNKRVKICKGIAKGLKYLHERQAVKMIHTGLKASNILLDGDFNAKLSDIGLGSLCAGNDMQEQFKLFLEEVKFGYAAPEYASQNVISFASDVYTFGVLVLEIVSGRRNSDGERFFSHGQSHEFLTEKVTTARDILVLVDERLISIDQTEARRILMLAKLCVDMDKQKRPTMSQVVSFLDNELTIDDVYKSLSPLQGGATTTETSKIATSDTHFTPTTTTTTIASGSTSPTYNS